VINRKNPNNKQKKGDNIMKKSIKNMFFIVFFLVVTQGIKANIFASFVEITYTGSFPATITYILNQDATTVQILVKSYPGGATVKTIDVASGATGAIQGFNDVAWDGSLDAGGTATSGVYLVTINASDGTGSNGWELLSYDTGPDSWYWSSAGVATNNNNPSPYFGMVYVTERSGGTSGNDGGSETIRGLYMHYPDGQYYGFDQAVAYAPGNAGVDWNALGANEGKPTSVYVGPDDRVYVWSLANNGDATVTGGVAVGDAGWSLASIDTVLSFYTLDNHSTISRAIVVGEGADRMLYTVEQVGSRYGSDSEGPTDGDGFDIAEVRSYAIGTSTGVFTGAHTVVIDSLTLPRAFALEMDASGYLYIAQSQQDTLAETELVYGLSKWDISGTTAVEMWHIGLDDAPPHNDPTHMATASSFTGIALDESNGRVYVARRQTGGRPLHNVIGYAMSDGALLSGFSFATALSIVGTDTTNLSGGGGNNIRDIFVDAAGNLVSVNSSSEALRMHSPPDGANNFVTYSPWAVDVDNGTVISTDLEDFVSTDNSGVQMPQHYTLSQNYPNPFNGTTVIEYTLPIASNVTLIIFDINGREVATLFDNRQDAGTYHVIWNGVDQHGRSLASGIYFYQITAPSSDRVTRPFNLVRRMVYLK
jgi:flagellar hook assembly protein FlgD